MGLMHCLLICRVTGSARISFPERTITSQPRYGDKIHGNDRWDLVNYVRSLQLNARAGQ